MTGHSLTLKLVLEPNVVVVLGIECLVLDITGKALAKPGTRTILHTTIVTSDLRSARNWTRDQERLSHSALELGGAS